MTELPFKVIAVFAKDWNMYGAQRDYRFDFEVCKGWTIGWLIREDDEKIVLAHQWFPEPKDIRNTTVIPKETIIYRVELEEITSPNNI